ncbi:hypothetical protein U27_04847 [Candidatus Vecturithrix granuli]|uniref:Uncharacterized protein n=1 Tax=Vecturithrix granuli TaxID=1499967 RepID=A0A081BZX0_VECG1|nr:hypothetical protein U27_04847 [Candidatus Vecturithrix granuli]
MPHVTEIYSFLYAILVVSWETIIMEITSVQTAKHELRTMAETIEALRRYL